MAGTVQQQIRDAAALLVGAHPFGIAVNEAAIARFWQTHLDGLVKAAADDASGEAGLRVPFNFDTLQSHLSFLGVHAVLCFGSGFRAELHDACGRGASETMLYGLMSLFLSSPSGCITARQLSDLTELSVAEHWALPFAREVEIAPGMYEQRDAPVRPLLRMIRDSLRETGDVLMRYGYADFGAFLLEFRGKTAAELMHQSCLIFPTFADDYYDATALPESAHAGAPARLPVFKKAQVLVAELVRQHRADGFDFPDCDTCTVCADNVLPTVLRALGLMQCDDALRASVELQRAMAFGAPEEAALRLGAIHTCEAILAARPPQAAAVCARSLDAYLWRLGKSEELRALPRHVCKCTRY